MLTLLIVLQGTLVLCMTLLVLMQKTSSDGMANIAGGGQSMHSSTGKGFLRKCTIFFAFGFILNSLVIAKISYHESNKGKSFIESIEGEKEESDED